MFLAYKLKVELLDVVPTVERTFIIPAETTFKRLHDTLQFTIGWKDYHLYEFTVKDEDYTTRIVCDEEMMEDVSGLLDHYKERRDNGEVFDQYTEAHINRMKKTSFKGAWSCKLPQIFRDNHEIEYMYDFGDSWRHKITLLEVINDYPYPYPVLLDGEGACPPEDVGGPGGYAYFLEAWHNPEHEEHSAMREWATGHFKEVFDLERTNQFMKEILKLKKLKK